MLTEELKISLRLYKQFTNNHRYHELVYEIIKSGNINLQDECGWSVLFWGIRDYENLGITLIKSGADLNIKNSDGDTPLIFATLLKKDFFVKLLIEHGADPNIKDNDGKTALDLVKRFNYKNGIELLENAEEIRRKYLEEHEEEKLKQILEEDKDKTEEEILEELVAVTDRVKKSLKLI